jgi:wyosine [tRNA(Phe)-imidazoG37] synthetase (radical SAM superfamily)
MRYVFGPVASRRLGYSLGVDIIPHKVCTLDCVYCQLGPTTLKAIERKPYVEAKPVLAELDEVLAKKGSIDCITFSGSGEPTLNACLGDIIAGIKNRCSLPVTVLTNGTLLHLPDVRAGLMQADIVCPSFDAASAAVFGRINRPHESLCVEQMIEGLAAFRREFTGRILLEVMIVRGVNDSLEELEKLAAAVQSFGADAIQINTVTRPGAEPGAGAADEEVLQQALKLFGPGAEIIGFFQKERSVFEKENCAERIAALVSRHPCTAADICSALGLTSESVDTCLTLLLQKGRISVMAHGGNTFYRG